MWVGDILSRLMHGARLSLIVVGIVVPGSALFGTLVGMTSGWKGGATGQILMRIVDIQLALPGILFALLLGSIFGPSLRNVIIILLIWTWSGYARLVRAEVLSLRERDFTTASRALGAGGWWIMRKHLFPNVVNTVVIIMTLEVAIVIQVEAALSFLGVGVPAGTASWGRMITEGREVMIVAWWPIWLPGSGAADHLADGESDGGLVTGSVGSAVAAFALRSDRFLRPRRVPPCDEASPPIRAGGEKGRGGNYSPSGIGALG